LGTTACIQGRSHQRDDRLYREIARQERWATDALAGRATADDLARIRQGDAQLASLGRKQLKKLTTAADRNTWIREAVAEGVREDGDDPRLAADYERAGRSRNDAYLAADELALALAETHNGVSLAELRAGLESYHRARASDARLARDLTKTSLAKVGAAPLPVPKPFIAAAARVAFTNPDEKLAGFAPEDVTEVRAAVAGLEKNPPQPAAVAANPVGAQAAGPNEAAPPAPAAAASPERSPMVTPAQATTLTVGNDAQKLIAKRGAPKSFATRGDGLFALRYEELRPCGVDSCATEVDYLFDASGTLVRDEAAPRKGP
jgi:hypothetical protein